MKARSPGGFSRRSSGLTRLRSPDALVLLSCVVAVILLLPLRELSGVFPPVAFAATLVLFTAPGLLLSHRLLRDDMSGAAQLLLGGITVAVYIPSVATFVGAHLIVPGLLWRLAWPIPLLALITTVWMVWEAIGYTEARLRGFGIGRSVTRVLPLAL